MPNISKVGQTAPHNLLHLFKRRLVETKEIEKLLKNIPEKERFLGHLPTDWFDINAPREEISSLTHSIFQLFSNFAQGVYVRNLKINRQFDKTLKTFSETLQELLHKNTDLRYCNRGEWGNVFKLSVGGNDYALKTFISGMKTSSQQRHGKTVEIANAIAYNHAKVRRARSDFYFGKIASKNDTDGFILTEFVKRNSQKTSDTTLLYDRFYTPDAYFGYNKINGKLIDYGYIENNYPSKEARLFAKELLNSIQTGDENLFNALLQKYRKSIDFNYVINKIYDLYCDILSSGDKTLKIKTSQIRLVEQIKNMIR